MKLGQIDFPDRLLSAIRDDHLVIFAGAGVSMGQPANLPSFWKLAQDIGASAGEKLEDGDLLDRFLGQLHHKGVAVHQLAMERLSGAALQHTALHENLLQLFRRIQHVRVVTTNFDVLFEQASMKLGGNATLCT
jgi:NAD-dependent SIR2 family protein deacetylase